MTVKVFDKKTGKLNSVVMLVHEGDFYRWMGIRTRHIFMQDFLSQEEAIHSLDENEDITWEKCEVEFIVKEESQNCPCCQGDVALFWVNNENNAFVDSYGEILVTAHDHKIRFNVDYCPRCGRKF